MSRVKRRPPRPEKVRAALEAAGHDTMTSAAEKAGVRRETLYRMLREGVRRTTSAGTVEALQVAGLLDLCR